MNKLNMDIIDCQISRIMATCVSSMVVTSGWVGNGSNVSTPDMALPSLLGDDTSLEPKLKM